MPQKPRSKKPKSRKSKSKKPFFNPLDWVIILAATIVAVAVAATDRTSAPVYLVADLIALITGAFYIVLSAKGLRSNFIFCIINTIIIIFIAWSNQFYGNAIINAVYYLPCAFIGYYLWGQNSRRNHEVIARKLTPRQLAIITLFVVVASFCLKFALDGLGGASTLLDSICTVASIIANLLVLLRYREQWLAWLVVDIAAFAMWATSGDPAMFTLRTLYLVGAIYGYIYWRRLVKSTPKSRRYHL